MVPLGEHLAPSGGSTATKVNNKEDYKDLSNELPNELPDKLPLGMSNLRACMAVEGTTAFHFAVANDTADINNYWADEYGAFVARLHNKRMALEMALSPADRAQLYLALAQHADTLVVLHRLHRWTANPPSQSVNKGQLVAFKGKTLGEDGQPPPNLMRFEEVDGHLFKLRSLAKIELDWVANFYNGTFPKRDATWFGKASFNDKTSTQLGRLIPIPTAWAALFLDYPNVGTAL